MVTEELHKLIRHIEIQTTHLAKETLAGSYHSAFKGRGIEFEEVREYIPGDEIRTIDWKVTARMNHPYVKNFREERELSVLLAVDVSASTHFGSQEQLKSERIAEIGGVLAFSAIQNNDKVGLVLYSDQVEKYIPPAKGTRHTLHLIRELLTWQSQKNAVDSHSLLTYLGNIQSRHSICFLITDLFTQYDPQKLSILAKKNDLVSIVVTDPRELELPNVGYVTLRDLETNDIKTINTGSESVRQEYAEKQQQRFKEIRKSFLQSGVGVIPVSTDQPYVPPINQFFKQRASR